VLGEKELFAKLESEIMQMSEGERKKISLKPAEAYGESRAELAVVIPMREFQKQKMSPFPGLVLEVNGRRGKVQSVGGGRVRVDFNHPLAGREIEYDVKVEKELKAAKEKVEALFDKYFSFLPEKERKLKIEKETVEIELPAKYSKILAELKARFSQLVTNNIKEIRKVSFIESFEKETPEKAPEAKEKSAKEAAETGKREMEKGKVSKKEGKKEGQK
jgi:FKBP-type peptidyl-prolyl cis-trans isomerase 2